MYSCDYSNLKVHDITSQLRYDEKVQQEVDINIINIQDLSIPVSSITMYKNDIYAARFNIGQSQRTNKIHISKYNISENIFEDESIIEVPDNGLFITSMNSNQDNIYWTKFLYDKWYIEEFNKTKKNINTLYIGDLNNQFDTSFKMYEDNIYWREQKGTNEFKLYAMNRNSGKIISTDINAESMSNIIVCDDIITMFANNRNGEDNNFNILNYNTADLSEVNKYNVGKQIGSFDSNQYYTLWSDNFYNCNVYVLNKKNNKVEIIHNRDNDGIFSAHLQGKHVILNLEKKSGSKYIKIINIEDKTFITLLSDKKNDALIFRKEENEALIGRIEGDPKLSVIKIEKK